LSPFLNIGTICATFQQGVTRPRSMLHLKIFVKGTASYVASSFKIPGRMPSGPGDLEVFDSLSNFTTVLISMTGSPIS